MKQWGFIVAISLFINLNVYSQVGDSTLVKSNKSKETDSLSKSNISAGDQEKLNRSLIIAAEKGDSILVVELLIKGANPNSETQDGVTALMYAAQNGFLTICDTLVSAGADVNKIPPDGTSAMLSAVKFNQLDVTEFLIRHNANINTKDIRGFTALHYSAIYCYYIMCDMLIYYDADIHASATDGSMPLHSAVFSGNINIVELFIQKEANLNAKDSLGFTALMLASQLGLIEISKLLVSKGSIPTLTNNQGCSAIELSLSNNQSQVVEYLISLEQPKNYPKEKAEKLFRIVLEDDNYKLYKLLKKSGFQKSFVPYFTKLNFGISHRFNPQDIWLGGSFGIFEAKYGLNLESEFSSRLGRKKVLIPIDNTSAYQLREKRYLIRLSIQKKFPLKSTIIKKQGLFLGISELYSWGNFEGMIMKPTNPFIVIPSTGYYLQYKFMEFKVAYEYMNLKTEKISPHWIVLNTNINLGFRKNLVNNKTFIW